ncbi:aminotransferase-like domain-containing protein [Nonomuraea angiospora]|uniref:aminotransferase-like domain-containing protein n=1 Tax=Nonomuraea angiospora TaxID=46172 RepID=UPI0029B7D336|nr:PLP-dependent aminotransferase family protein [Nonomuraea angiospora]MDX3102143.1 PLP-dependent aminotransferase family protein [Nonomuraea angiospora]
MRSPRRLSVPIQLDRDLPEPLHDQLAAQLRRAIAGGRLIGRMPSTRTLAAVLGVSRGVALAAYEVLLAEGHITGRHGSGTYVSGPEDGAAPGAVARRSGQKDGAAPRAVAGRSGPVDAREAVVDLRWDRPSTQAFPLAAWRAAWRRASHQAPPVDEPPAAGLPELRAAIAAYLRESRGLVLDGHEVVVTAGYADALALILRARHGAGGALIALEDPAPPGLRRALARLGTVLPLRTDGSGARPDLVPAGCDVVAVLPERGALGARMPTERRLALAAWARESGGLVLEPAFDGLFNPSLSPRPSVLALGEAGSTAMVGSFCDLLTPTLRLAFAVVPRRLAGAIEEGMSAGHGQPSFTCQLAVRDLLASGCVAGRAERLSVLYGAKRAFVRQALGAYPDTRLLGADTGAAAGIAFGYGHLDPVTLRRALHALTGTLDDHRLPRRSAA